MGCWRPVSVGIESFGLTQYVDSLETEIGDQITIDCMVYGSWFPHRSFDEGVSLIWQVHRVTDVQAATEGKTSLSDERLVAVRKVMNCAGKWNSVDFGSLQGGIGRMKGCSRL